MSLSHSLFAHRLTIYTMVLEGFSSALYVGWVSGVLPLKSPKGPPTPSPMKSVHTVATFLGYVVMTLLWVDFHIRHLKVLQKDKDNSVEKFLSLSLFIGASIFDLYFRLCFLLRVKIVARFLKALETDMVKMTPFTRLVSPEGRRTWNNYKNLIFVVHTYHCLGAVITSLWVAALIPDDTKLLGFIPKSVYPIIFFLFAAVPLVSSFFVSFSLVICTTSHIEWVFADFCKFFEEQIDHHEQQLLNPMKRDLGEIYSITGSKTNKNVGSNADVLNKFEHLKLICSQYDKICGPLLLGLLVRAVFILISSANTMLLYDGAHGAEHKRIKLILNVYHFVTEMSQLVLLQLGHVMQSKVNKKTVEIKMNGPVVSFFPYQISDKEEDLHRKVILMKNLGPRDQMKEAIAIISEWKWSISGGPGFFEVDRPLLSGVRKYILMNCN